MREAVGQGADLESEGIATAEAMDPRWACSCQQVWHILTKVREKEAED